MTTENKPIKVDVIAKTALESIERASIDMQISTAKQYPMHSPNMLSKVKDEMLTLATLDEETAASCFYTLPRGGKAIQGPSVRLAEIAMNCYGNIRVGARILEVVCSGDTPHVVVQSVCHDLENNTLITIEKRRRITKKKFKDEVDEDDIQLAVNACTSIAYRDAAFKLIPMAIIKPVWQAAKKLAIGDVRSLSARRADVIDRLRKMGVIEERILAVVGCRRIEDIGIDQLGQLIGLGTALKDGETTLEDAFPPIQAENAVKNGTGISGLKTAIIAPPVPEESKTPPESDINEILDEALAEPENAPESTTDDLNWICKKCGLKFDKPKGNKRKLCPDCLDENIIDIRTLDSQ